ncbi:MAG: 2-dehydropantoate 2-reductase [Lachnospiraceae bacterium]|nr:2-dehydropantoate 2-reductase [Lachnospiraceae bacterium]
MKVALIGAGAVGGYFIHGFENAKEPKREFCVIADKERRERLIKDGVKINGSLYRPCVKTPEEAGVQDLVIVAVKGNTLPFAVELLPPLVGEKTYVMSMLNGADSEEVIADKIGSGHVLHSIILIASRRANGEIVFDTDYNTTVYYGASDEVDAALGLKTVEDAFAGTDMNVLQSEDIMFDIWSKYAKNICNNLPQAMLTAPAALYTRSEHGLFIARKLWAEVRQLAKLRGVDLPEEVGIYPCADSSRYSTLQDIDAKRRTEVDSLCGYLLKMAKDNGIEVPYIEYTYHAIKALEEKNEGLFD